MVNFYASITPQLLENSLTFATSFTRISKETKTTIMQATNSFLCSNGQTWIKRESGKYDITMGGFHGAEICELVGLHILSKLKHILPNVGLYRDDGLAVSSATPRQNEPLKKQICKVFKDIGLSVTITANTTKVDFLDISMDLQSGIYQPFIKENDSPM